MATERLAALMISGAASHDTAVVSKKMSTSPHGFLHLHGWSGTSCGTVAAK